MLYKVNNTKQYFDLLSIENDILILKNSTYSKILEIFPDNFILSDIDERERFLKKYEEFLLSIKFNIEIVSINFKIKRKENLKYINNIVNKKMKELYRTAFLSDQDEIFKNIYNQRFFLVYSVIKKRKYLDYKKDLKEVEDLFISQEKQLKYMLSSVPLSFKKLKGVQINHILNYFFL